MHGLASGPRAGWPRHLGWCRLGLVAVWCLLPMLLAQAGCRESRPAGTGPAAKVRVVATTGMVADLVKRVGGDRVEVKALMGEGVDPHLYRPTPGDLRLLEQADLIVYNGLMLEGRMADVFDRLGAKKPTLAVTAKIDRTRVRRLSDAPAASGEDHDDPHVWFDVGLWSQGVGAVRDALVAVDAPGRADYEERAERYLRELAELDAWCREQIAGIPEARRVLVTAHDAFGYFGRAYGLEVRGIQGVSTDSEASVASMSELVNLLVSRRIGAVFVESSVPRRTVEALVEGAAARGHVVRVGGELFSDAMGGEGTPEGTYVGMVRHNVKTIVEALR